METWKGPNNMGSLSPRLIQLLCCWTLGLSSSWIDTEPSVSAILEVPTHPLWQVDYTEPLLPRRSQWFVPLGSISVPSVDLFTFPLHRTLANTTLRTLTENLIFFLGQRTHFMKNKVIMAILFYITQEAARSIENWSGPLKTCLGMTSCRLECCPSLRTKGCQQPLHPQPQ
jgi:hypothetical protein